MAAPEGGAAALMLPRGRRSSSRRTPGEFRVGPDILERRSPEGCRFDPDHHQYIVLHRSAHLRAL